jgi:hypothetical protein
MCKVVVEVLVRGNRSEAEDAAKLRGFPVVGASRYSERHNETTLTLPGWCYAGAVAWYCEPQGPPFPAGTALYYMARAAVAVE